MTDVRANDFGIAGALVRRYRLFYAVADIRCQRPCLFRAVRTVGVAVEGHTVSGNGSGKRQAGVVDKGR